MYFTIFCLVLSWQYGLLTHFQGFDTHADQNQSTVGALSSIYRGNHHISCLKKTHLSKNFKYCISNKFRFFQWLHRLKQPPVMIKRLGGHDGGFWVARRLRQQWTLIIKLLDQWRLQIQQHVMVQHHISYGGVIQGVILGQLQDLPSKQREVFKRTGTLHLLAISGLHIGLVIQFIRQTSRFCLYRLLHGSRYFLIMIDVFAWAIGWLYAGLAQLPVSTQRACWMAGGVLLLRHLRISWPPLVLASCVAVGMFCYSPDIMSKPSFWLSFSGVWVLLSMTGVSNLWMSHLNWPIFICLGVVSIWFFQHWALGAILANLLAIPFFSVWVVPLSLLGAIALLIKPAWADLFWWLAGHGVATLWPCLEHLSNWGYMAWHQAPLWAHILVLLSVYCWFGPWPRCWRWFTCVWWIPFITQSIENWPQRKEVRLVVFEVGQGLATAIQTQHHILLYDFGPSSRQDFSATRRILPWLTSLGIHQVGKAMVSHGDLDHRGGLSAVLATVPIVQIISGQTARLRQPSMRCHAGQSWQWDGVLFEVLWPITNTNLKRNNQNSCVLLVSTQAGNLLLTGDIDRQVEAILVKHYPKLKSRVLLVPHHGSKTSSSLAFLRHIRPELACISSGQHNRFHLPSPVVLKRYQALHIPVLDTQKYGTIRVLLTKNGLQVDTDRPHANH